MTSLRVLASDKAIKWNWCCTFVPIGADLYTVAPSLGQSSAGPSPGKVGVCGRSVRSGHWEFRDSVQKRNHNLLYFPGFLDPLQ